jgi:hypothetical protein
MRCIKGGKMSNSIQSKYGKNMPIILNSLREPVLLCYQFHVWHNSICFLYRDIKSIRLIMDGDFIHLQVFVQNIVIDDWVILATFQDYNIKYAQNFTEKIKDRIFCDWKYSKAKMLTVMDEIKALSSHFELISSIKCFANNEKQRVYDMLQFCCNIIIMAISKHKGDGSCHFFDIDPIDRDIVIKCDTNSLLKNEWSLDIRNKKVIIDKGFSFDKYIRVNNYYFFQQESSDVHLLFCILHEKTRLKLSS